MTSNLPPTLAASMLAMTHKGSIVHQIVSEDRALQADLEILRLKQSGEFDRRRWDAAQRQQTELMGATGRTM